MASQAAWNKGFLGSLVALGVFVAIVLAAFGLQSTATAHPGAAPSPSVTATPSATGTGTPAPSCDPKFVQAKADYGPDNRVDGTFEKAYADTVANKTGADKEKAQRELILSHSANNAQRLAIWAHANGLYADPNDWKKLVAGDCLSKEGQDLYNKLDGALSAGGTKFSEGNAPQSGYNSGTLPDGTYSVANGPGIASGTLSIVITYKDGTKVYILVHCGNVIFPTPPAQVPTSPMIPQPPKPVPTPPQKPICEMVPTLPQCLEAKIPSQDPAQNGNAGNGGGLNADPGPGPYVPPSQMQQPPPTPRVNPAPPAPTQPPAPPAVVPVVPTTPLPTVAPSEQPVNNGKVNPNPSSGPCNPDFQNCA